MEQLIIRPAQLTDLDTLLRFEQGVIHAERPFDPTLKPDPNSYYDIPGMIADPTVELVVAELEGKLIGSGYARILPAKKFLNHERYGYLGFMYVLPQFRGKGINARIIEMLKAWCAGQGLNELRLEVYCRNENAIRAYERSGFRQHMVEMRLPLAGGGDF